MKKIRSVFVLAIIFVVAGAVLTLENVGYLKGASRLWPLFPGVVGAGFLFIYFERNKSDHALMFLGTVLAFLAMFFFYLNFTTWRQIATLWPVFLGIMGMGFLSIYLTSRIRLFLFLALSLMLIAAVFYLVFGVSLALWPLSLVAFGASLLIVNHFYIRR